MRELRSSEKRYTIRRRRPGPGMGVDITLICEADGRRLWSHFGAKAETIAAMLAGRGIKINHAP